MRGSHFQAKKANPRNVVTKSVINIIQSGKKKSKKKIIRDFLSFFLSFFSSFFLFSFFFLSFFAATAAAKSPPLLSIPPPSLFPSFKHALCCLFSSSSLFLSSLSLSLILSFFFSLFLSLFVPSFFLLSSFLLSLNAVAL